MTTYNPRSVSPDSFKIWFQSGLYALRWTWQPAVALIVLFMGLWAGGLWIERFDPVYRAALGSCMALLVSTIALPAYFGAALGAIRSGQSASIGALADATPTLFRVSLPTKFGIAIFAVLFAISCTTGFVAQAGGALEAVSLTATMLIYINGIVLNPLSTVMTSPIIAVAQPLSGEEQTLLVNTANAKNPWMARSGIFLLMVELPGYALLVLLATTVSLLFAPALFACAMVRWNVSVIAYLDIFEGVGPEGFKSAARSLHEHPVAG